MNDAALWGRSQAWLRYFSKVTVCAGRTTQGDWEERGQGLE